MECDDDINILYCEEVSYGSNMWKITSEDEMEKVGERKYKKDSIRDKI